MKIAQSGTDRASPENFLRATGATQRGNLPLGQRFSLHKFSFSQTTPAVRNLADHESTRDLAG